MSSTQECPTRNRRVYLDNNATTPYAPEVREVISSALAEHWENPSCGYEEGCRAKALLIESRAKVAAAIGCRNADEVIFTSGGTEANNWLVRCVELQQASSKQPAHIVTSNIEHASVSLPIGDLCSRNPSVTCTHVPADASSGAVRVEDVVAALTPLTVLVSVMLANNETGVVQPISAMSSAVRAWAATAGVRPPPAVHTDAAQALGKIPVDVARLGVDFLTLAGHKFYGPRIGALYARTGAPLRLRPMLLGGGQEGGLRSGTENLAMVAGLARACQLVSDDRELTAAKCMAETCSQLRRGLSSALGERGVQFNCRSAGAAGGDGLDDDPTAAAAVGANVLPNTCSVALLCIPAACTGRDVLSRCHHVVAGVGSACHTHASQDSGSITGSSNAGTGSSNTGTGSSNTGTGTSNTGTGSTLTRSGVSANAARCTLRLSTGRYTSSDDIAVAVADIVQAVQQLQGEYGSA